MTAKNREESYRNRASMHRRQQKRKHRRQERFRVTWIEDGDLCIDYFSKKAFGETWIKVLLSRVRDGDKISNVTAPERIR
jgi:hypothetical protein|tara:strand:+ start:112 stop:351 length:240 start_codon:yes stop_codon:yes gene_type:complete